MVRSFKKRKVKGWKVGFPPNAPAPVSEWTLRARGPRHWEHWSPSEAWWYNPVLYRGPPRRLWAGSSVGYYSHQHQYQQGGRCSEPERNPQWWQDDYLECAEWFGHENQSVAPQGSADPGPPHRYKTHHRPKHPGQTLGKKATKALPAYCGTSDPPPGRCSGVISFISEEHGLIKCDDLKTFHFSVKAYWGNPAHMLPGVKVQFTLYKTRWKAEATDVVVAPGGTEEIDSKVFEGFVSKALCDEKVLETNLHKHGFIQTSVFGSVQQLPFGQGDTKATLLPGDRVRFRLLKDLVTKFKRASRIELLPESLQASQETREKGIITSLVEDSGTIQSEQHNSIQFDLQEIVGEVVLCVKDQVEFMVVTVRENLKAVRVKKIEALLTKSDMGTTEADDTGRDLVQSLGQDLQAEVSDVLPQRTVVFEDVDLEQHKGTVITPFVKLPENTQDDMESDVHPGLLVTTSADGEEKKLPFGLDDVLSQATMMEGDRVQFNISTNRSTKTERATNIEILPETFQQFKEPREMGLVVSLTDSSGYIDNQRNQQLFFRIGEVLDEVRLDLSDNVEFTVVPDLTNGHQAVRIRKLLETSLNNSAKVEEKVTCPLGPFTEKAEDLVLENITVMLMRDSTEEFQNLKVKVENMDVPQDDELLVEDDNDSSGKQMDLHIVNKSEKASETEMVFKKTEIEEHVLEEKAVKSFSEKYDGTSPEELKSSLELNLKKTNCHEKLLSSPNEEERGRSRSRGQCKARSWSRSRSRERTSKRHRRYSRSHSRGCISRGESSLDQVCRYSCKQSQSVAHRRKNAEPNVDAVLPLDDLSERVLDEKLAEKKRELELLEEEIARKRAIMAFERNKHSLQVQERMKSPMPLRNVGEQGILQVKPDGDPLQEKFGKIIEGVFTDVHSVKQEPAGSSISSETQHDNAKSYNYFDQLSDSQTSSVQDGTTLTTHPSNSCASIAHLDQTSLQQNPQDSIKDKSNLSTQIERFLNTLNKGVDANLLGLLIREAREATADFGDLQPCQFLDLDGGILDNSFCNEHLERLGHVSEGEAVLHEKEVQNVADSACQVYLDPEPRVQEVSCGQSRGKELSDGELQPSNELEIARQEPLLPPPNEEDTQEKMESKIQNILETIGYKLDSDEVRMLAERTQKCLYGKRKTKVMPLHLTDEQMKSCANSSESDKPRSISAIESSRHDTSIAIPAYSLVSQSLPPSITQCTQRWDGADCSIYGGAARGFDYDQQKHATPTQWQHAAPEMYPYYTQQQGSPYMMANATGHQYGETSVHYHGQSSFPIPYQPYMPVSTLEPHPGIPVACAQVPGMLLPMACGSLPHSVGLPGLSLHPPKSRCLRMIKMIKSPTEKDVLKQLSVLESSTASVSGQVEEKNIAEDLDEKIKVKRMKRLEQFNTRMRQKNEQLKEAQKVVQSEGKKPSAGEACKALKHVWLCGHLLVYLAEKRAALPPCGTQLGLDASMVRLWWKGSQGLPWSKLLPLLTQLKKMWPEPDVIVMHVGGNDLGKGDYEALLGAVRKDLISMKASFPRSTLVWSDILPRRTWKAVEDVNAIESVRLTVNQRVREEFISLGGSFISHDHIQPGLNSGLYCPDGIRLSGKGVDQFNADVQNFLKKFEWEHIQGEKLF